MEPIEIVELFRKNNKEISKILRSPFVNFSRSNNYDIDSKFEYFYQKNYRNIKLLHLLFYKEGCSINQKKEIYSSRKRQILSLFKLINKNNNFNFSALREIFDQVDNFSFPIQYAIEFYEKIKKIKIYFSNTNGLKNNNDAINLIRELMDLLSIKERLKPTGLLGEGIDSVGIDFLNNREANFKIYTFYHSKFKLNKIKRTIRNQFRKYRVKESYLRDVLKKIAKLDYSEWGFLYRISNNGKIVSVKFWYRIAPVISASFKLKEKCLLKISFITCDQNGIGYYLRENEKKENLLNRDYLFKEITEKIAETDFTGYTVQYPPLMTWKPIDNKLISEWESICSNDKLGLYIHIPFCSEKCTFCRYYSERLLNKKNIGRFLNSLRKEIYLYKLYLKNKKFSTLYIGGGTPTIFDEMQLRELFLIIDENFKFVKDAQKCIEATPNTLNNEKLKIIKEFGINRLTIGIQTLTSSVLKNANRYHPGMRKMVSRAILQARDVGIDRINVDLMAGLPGETERSFTKMFNEAIQFMPDMVHIHPFYPTSYTKFMRKGSRLSEKDMDLRNKMSSFAKDILISSGYKSIKFDAMGKDEKSKNIQLSDAIENISSYLGLGPGAVSHIRDKIRYVNFDDVKLYISNLSKKQAPIMKGVILKTKDEMIYYVIACLRYGEVSKIGFFKIFKKQLKEVFNNEIEYLKERKLIVEEKDRIVARFNNIGEYLVYSKYFYPTNLVNYFKRKYFTKQRELLEVDTKYMLL